ncbi:hypothetical protein GSS88_09235 [Corynebacterium sp. 3HC-13]|uniref:MFS transporter n=1 Tax=Corynebacterium poyangense TaxID=2684405 RepID=UPI001CCFE2AA|nr:MFS transporter [Corynebacterium poyangense]MBZ8177966.1 hypothetical protein [Corynebacterium poyangense]
MSLGAATGGIMIAVGLSRWGLVIDAVSFLVTALIVRCVVEPRVMEQKDGVGARKYGDVLSKLNVYAQWSQLMSVSRRSSWLPLWAVTSMIGSICGGVMSVALPLVLVDKYDSTVVGAYQSLGVCVLVLGALGAKIYRSPRFPGFGVVFGSLGDYLASGLIALGCPGLWPISAKCASSFASAYSSPFFTHFVSKQFDKTDQGKVFALQTGVSSVLAPVGMALSGIVLKIIETSDVLLISAIAGMVLSAAPLLKTGILKFDINE